MSNFLYCIVGLLHGDMQQVERSYSISMFKDGGHRILIATSIASRGLDIPAIKTVVNYEAPKDDEDNTHRVGRTARAGTRGNAYTLLLRNQYKKAGTIYIYIYISFTLNYYYIHILSINGQSIRESWATHLS